ncbi:MAG: response regulator transcription factor [Anaerolineales bacterium]|nr:response regulator transcription factor [Anaerolineales bacterium]
MPKIRLLLVDDHGVVRSGLRMLLEAEPDMEIVGEATSGQEAIELVQLKKPHIVLMDVQMPGINGIEATREIKRLSPETAVLTLTMYENEQYFLEMLKAGASGYVPKRAAPDELVDAIRTVSQGDVFLHPTMANLLVQNYLVAQDAPAEEEGDSIEMLTPREQEVLVQIAEGLTNAEIAQKLHISVKTVDRHRENMMQKLNMHSRIDLVKFAIRKGLISLDD